jgi:D-amino-acid dehydrogenase
VKQDAIVVGAGVIGLATAYFLVREGLSVTVVDEGEPGGGCSFGNMGWVCPSLAGPLPSPGIVGSSLLGMLDGTSPLYVKPSEIIHIWPWLLSFWRHSTAAHYAAGLEANLWLNRNTLALYDQWVADGVAFEMHNQGLMYVFRDIAEWHHKLETASQVADYGFPAPRKVDKEALGDLEPDLGPDVVGGILLPAERHVRPDSLTAGLVERLQKAGVTFRTGVTVDTLEADRSGIRSLRAGGGRLQADVYVLAAGVHTTGLAKQAGLSLPVIPGKGYSLTINGPNLSVRHPLYLGDTKVAVSPYRGTLRIGGTMEFSGPNTRIDMQRVNSIRRASELYFRTPPAGKDVAVWTGMRPMTPDGLPVIGKAPRYGNLFIASGHGSDGVFMAPATGSLLRDLIMGRPCPPEARAFDPGRFG